MSALDLAKLRDLLHGHMNEVTTKGSATNIKIVRSFRTKYSKQIASAEKDLIGRALARLVSQLSSRRPKLLFGTAQRDLFQPYSELRGTVVIDGRYRSINNLTKRELRALIERLDKPRSNAADRRERKAFARLLNDIADVGTDETTIEQALRKKSE